ncbi:MAG: hypothetical protein U0694_18100 [Anaerolineae bacterium]
MDKSETVVALYDRMDNAQDAIVELVAAGFPRSEISLIARSAVGEYVREGVEEDVSGGEGAGFGAIVGGFTGLVVGLGTIVIPGIGPILAAGPLVALMGGVTGAAVGATVGAVTGGLTASLVNLGVPSEYADYYSESVRRGSILLTVNAVGEDARDAANILMRHHPVDVQGRADDWRKEGWKGFDPNAEPYEFKANDASIPEDETEPPTNDNTVRRYPVLPPERR